LSDFISKLPKAELHLHLEGTLEPEMMLEKAKKNGVKLPYKSIEDVKNAYKFKDLQSFLDLYYLGVSSLVDEQDFYDLAYAYFKKAASQNVVRAEVFFDPQAHTRRGVDFSTVIKGIHKAALKAEEDFGISIGIIMSFLRDMPVSSAEETLEQALQYKSWIIGVGLDSKELGNPPSKFEKVFKRARDEGFIAVAHAGEEAPAEYVWEAIKLLKVSRIDHGYHILDDPILTEKVAQEKIPLTTCPLSALKLNHIVPLEKFPVKTMMKLGMIPTINSDDPAYFGGYINENYYETAKALKLSAEDLVILAKHSIMASYISNEKKVDLYNNIDRIYYEIF
jgi:adenosine deaminase